MSTLLYSQTRGFEEFERPPSIAWAESEAWETYSKRVGYSSMWAMGRDPSTIFPGAAAYLYEGKEKDIPKYLVDVEGDFGSWVYVRNSADLFALRIQLSHLLSDELVYLVREMHMMTERTYRKYHEHDIYEVCNECDPAEHQRIIERRAERRKAEAEQRIVVVRNEVTERLLILHCLTEAKALEWLTSTQTHLQEKGTDPQRLKILLMFQGTSRMWGEIINSPELVRGRLEGKNNLVRESPEIRLLVNQLAQQHGKPPCFETPPSN